MICRTRILAFDGDEGDRKHAAVGTAGATGLRFVAVAVLDRATATYAVPERAPGLELAWVPTDAVPEGTADAALVDAAFAQPDQIPLLAVPPGRRGADYFTDHGASFPVVHVKGRAMLLAVRVTGLSSNTHGQLTFGWELSQSSRRSA